MNPASEFARTIAEITDEKTLARAVSDARTAHRARFAPHTGGRVWMMEHAQILDEAVRRIFILAQNRAAQNPPSEIPAVAIIATGGYGQKLLAPYSDLDITFVTARDDNSFFLHILFQMTMDVLLSGAKIKIGYAYRTLGEVSPPAGASGLDHQSQTALLDARLVAGNSALFTSFDQQVRKTLHIAPFLFFKEAERTRVRRAAWSAAGGSGGESGGSSGSSGSSGDTAHPVSPLVTEPNLKEGPGGLRDWQSAAWMAQVRWSYSDVWREMVRRKIITKSDLEAGSAARDFLLTVRYALHLSAGERRDVLSVGRQETVAAALDFSQVETFMDAVYQAASHLDLLWHKIKTRCLDAPLPLGPDAPGLSCVRGRVLVTNPALAAQTPWPLHAFLFCQTHDLELAPAAFEALQTFQKTHEWAQARREARRLFLRLLCAPGAAGKTVRQMEAVGILSDFLPDLSACMRLIPYDTSHAATVGEHSIRVLENLVALRDTKPSEQTAPYHAALHDVGDLGSLFLAALLHDIGKNKTAADAARGHAEVGAERINKACARLHAPPSVISDVTFLVRNHLKLAEVSRLRDLSLPRTIQEVAALTETPLRLRLLFLLTWADTKAVGPGVWNARSDRLLLELFARTDAHFADADTKTPVNETKQLSTVRERLQRKLIAPAANKTSGRGEEGVPPRAAYFHTEAMPAAYLLNTPPETIALHVQLIEQWQDAGLVPVLDMRVGFPDTLQTALTLVTADDPAPGLLAKITGVLLACDIRLHAAQVWTRTVGEAANAPGTSQRIALDTLFVDFHDRPLGPILRRTVSGALLAVLTRQTTVDELLQQKRKTVESGLPAFRVRQTDDKIAPDYVLLDVEAPDDRGTLYRFAAAFAKWGWHIRAARVSRWGGKARYAFYLAGADGKRITQKRLTAHLEPFLISFKNNT